MLDHNTAKISIILLIVSFCCCAGIRQNKLTVEIGQPVHYISDDGYQFVARYGSLSDKSLHFVKVQMPDGREYTSACNHIRFRCQVYG